MDDTMLAARLAACEGQITRLRRTLGTAGAALVLVCAVALGGFTKSPRLAGAPPLESLRVHELLVVDRNGTVRARVGGNLPDAVYEGRDVPRGDEAAGVLLYDHTGVERGGYVTFTKSGNVALTLDNPGRQVALFAAGPNRDDGAVARLWRQKDWAEMRVDDGGPHIAVGRGGELAFIAPEPTPAEAGAMCTDLKSEVAHVKPAPPTSAVLEACKAHASDGVCRKCLGVP